MSIDIVADIGGTNTRICRIEDGHLNEATLQKFKNDDFDSFDQVLERYGTDGVARLCIDIAGPVDENTARLTNRDWVFERSALADRFGFQGVHIINDLQAQGYGVWACDPFEKPPVIAAKYPRSGPKLVVNVGTGFNASPVYTVAGQAFVPQNEAGHVALAVPGMDHLTGTDGFLSVESLLSGRGFKNHMTDQSGTSFDQDADIWDAVRDQNTQAAQAFASFAKGFGAVTGDLALTHLPFGGIFLVGGVAEAAAPLLNASGFEDGFKSKGRFGAFMDQFSVVLCDDPSNALRGCQTYLAHHQA